MDILYIPQLGDAAGDGSGSVGTPPGRYRLVTHTVEEGKVELVDGAVNKIVVKTAFAFALVLPPRLRNRMRDLFVRIVIESDSVPEIVFRAVPGERFSLENADLDPLECRVGVNLFALSEVDDGVFYASVRRHAIRFGVDFDPRGGTASFVHREYGLGEAYGELPTCVRPGYVFKGWRSGWDESVVIGEGDICVSSVHGMVAAWETYEDPFAPHVCLSGNLTLYSDCDIPWTVDESFSYSPGGSVRSGAVGDNASSVLYAEVATGGRISFRWTVESEADYDSLVFLVDGSLVAQTSGQRASEWQSVEAVVTPGAHRFEWRYSKDGSVSTGRDCGWVDDIEWRPEGS